MAITIDGKVYRNLEEQVEKNKKDIAEFKEQAQSLSQFGIKVVSQVAVEGLIPSVIAYKAAHSDWEYGDTYAVGSEAPYKLYILTRADEDDHPEDYWFNIGQFPVAGPQGAQGIQGETGPQGVRGSKWSVGTSFPSSAQTGDLFLYSTTSQVYQYNGSTWDSVASIKGAQGVQGIQGIQGIQGVQGPQGPQGLQGNPGDTFVIKSTLSSTSLLPDPDTSPRNEAYLIPVNDINHIYIIEEVDDTLSWVDAGQFTGAQGETGPQGPQGLQGETGPSGPTALEYPQILIATSEPAVNSTYLLTLGNFNRTPEQGEPCTFVIKWSDGTSIRSYLATCYVGEISSDWYAQVVNLVETTGSQGIQGEMGALNSSEEITYDSTTQSCLLASTVRNKINSALQTPMSAPTTHYIVGIDSTNAQENISIGSGLEIDNGALKATGGGYTAGQNISISSDGVISVIGNQSGTNAFAVGQGASANNTAGTAIGVSAVCTGSKACQIGQGSNGVANSLQYRTTQIVDTNGKIVTNNLAGVSTATAGQVLTANGDGTATFQTAGGGGGGLTEYNVELIGNNNFLNICRRVNYYAKGRVWIEIPDVIDSGINTGNYYKKSIVVSDNIIGLNFSRNEDYYRYRDNVLEIDNSEVIVSLRKTTSGSGPFNGMLMIQHNDEYNTSTGIRNDEYECTDFSEYIGELTSVKLYYENDSEISFT